MLMILLSWYKEDHFVPDERKKRWYDYTFEVSAALSITGSLVLPFLI